MQTQQPHPRPHAPATLTQVEYFGEVGTGLGPTLEFYALVSHELRKAELNLWHHEEVPKEATVEAPGAETERSREKLVHAPCGLFPRPVAQAADGAGVPKRTLQLFTFMGRFIAKAMLDSRLVDLNFAPPFYRHLLGAELGMDDLSELSPQLARSLGQLAAIARERTRLLATCEAGRSVLDVAEDISNLTLHGCPIDQLGLDFTLPGFPEMELVLGGKDKEVTIDNLGEYVQLVLRSMLHDSVRAQVSAFKRGFSEVFGVRKLACFSPAELDVLFNGAPPRPPSGSRIFAFEARPSHHAAPSRTTH
jgi:E3 ubiquitin-protein ligase TRIP12